MPTSKKRLNLVLPKQLALILETLAQRDDVSQAAKALELIQQALDIEEDAILSQYADDMVSQKKDFVSHEDFWSEALAA